jgi:hypothetical protein
MKSDVLVIIAFLSELRKNPQIVLQFIHQSTHLSPSGLREPLFVGLGQKDGLDGQRLRNRVSHS